MKLAFYSGLVGDAKTGWGVYLSNLMRQMLALRPQAEYVSFLASARHAELHRQSVRHIDHTGRLQARTVTIPGRALNFTQNYLHLPPMRMLLGQPYDLYHQMWASTDPAVPSHKLVVSLHDTVSLRWPGHEGKLFKRIRPLLQRAAAVVTVSEYSRQTIIENFGVRPERVRVIYNGCDHETFRPEPDELALEQTQARLGIAPPYLFYIGGQTPRKNLPRLIAAFAQARRMGGLPHSLVLAGPLNPLQSAVAQAIADSGCSANIKLLNYVPDEVVPQLYQGSAALVFPSLHEGFGLPVVEALACGTPVVTSNVTSLPEVAGDAALLVDPESVGEIANGILSVLSENETARKLRLERGIRQAQQFTWQRCAEAHLEIYDEVMAKGKL